MFAIGFIVMIMNKIIISYRKVAYVMAFTPSFIEDAINTPLEDVLYADDGTIVGDIEEAPALGGALCNALTEVYHKVKHFRHRIVDAQVIDESGDDFIPMNRVAARLFNDAQRHIPDNGLPPSSVIHMKISNNGEVGVKNIEYIFDRIPKPKKIIYITGAGTQADFFNNSNDNLEDVEAIGEC